jgi:hypothetical protein
LITNASAAFSVTPNTPITTMDLEERQHYFKWEGIEATVMVDVANLQSYACSVGDHNFVNN